MKEFPVLTDEEEAQLVRQHSALRRLGGSKLPTKRVHCPRCCNDYNAGSGHRGSLWCDATQRSRLLRERGLSTLSFTYVRWFDELRIPYEVHLTGHAARYISDPVTGAIVHAYKGVSALDPRLWVPKDVTLICGRAKEPKKSRLQKLSQLRDSHREAWIAAEFGQHGLRWDAETRRWIPR